MNFDFQLICQLLPIEQIWQAGIVLVGTHQGVEYERAELIFLRVILGICSYYFFEFDISEIWITIFCAHWGNLSQTETYFLNCISLLVWSETKMEDRAFSGFYISNYLGCSL